MTEFAKELFALDRGIRAVCIVDEMAELLALEIQPHVRKSLSDEELQKFLVSWIIQINIFQQYEHLTGPVRYYTVNFTKLDAAAIPLKQPRLQKEDDRYVGRGRTFAVISFELGTDIKHLVEDKMLPMINQRREFFI